MAAILHFSIALIFKQFVLYTKAEISGAFRTAIENTGETQRFSYKPSRKPRILFSILTISTEVTNRGDLSYIFVNRNTLISEVQTKYNMYILV